MFGEDNRFGTLHEKAILLTWHCIMIVSNTLLITLSYIIQEITPFSSHHNVVIIYSIGKKCTVAGLRDGTFSGRMDSTGYFSYVTSVLRNIQICHRAALTSVSNILHASKAEHCKTYLIQTQILTALKDFLYCIIQGLHNDVRCRNNSWWLLFTLKAGDRLHHVRRKELK